MEKCIKKFKWIVKDFFLLKSYKLRKSIPLIIIKHNHSKANFNKIKQIKIEKRYKAGKFLAH